MPEEPGAVRFASHAGIRAGRGPVTALSTATPAYQAHTYVKMRLKETTHEFESL